MQIIDSLFKKLGYVKARQAQNLVSSVTTTPSGISPDKTYSDLVEAYTSWAYVSIDKISKTVASLPLKLYIYRNKQGQKIINSSGLKIHLKQYSPSDQKLYLKEKGIEKEEVLDHPYLDLIKRPNDIMSRFALWYETMTRLELFGLCAWYLVKGAFGLPARIWTLPLTKNAEIKPVVSSKLEILKWIYKDGDINVSFKPDEIIAIKYPHPASPFKWYSPLLAMQYPYDIDTYLMQTQNALLQNKGVPGLTLQTDQELTREQVKDVREQINEQLGSVSKRGNTFILHSGFKKENTPWSPTEAGFDKMEEYARQKLLAGFDLSDGKVGLVKDANRANMEALDHTYIKECIRPKTMILEEIQETFLLPIYDLGLTLDFDLPDNTDKDLKLKERQINLQTGYTIINEEREKDGMQPVPWGNEPWFPMGLMQPGMMTAQDQDQKIYHEKGISKWSEDKKRRTWEITENRRKRWEAVFAQQMAGYFRIQKDDIIKRLEKYGPRIEAGYAGWSKKRVSEHIKEKGIGDNINIDPEEEAKRLKETFIPLLSAAIEDQANKFYSDIGLGYIFNVNHSDVKKYIGSRLDRFSREVSGTTFNEIKAILREGYTEGQGTTLITETLRSKFDAWEKWRAPLIARTEIAPSMNKADLLAAKQVNVSGLILKSWISARDGAVRDTHLDADLKYVDGIPMNENFEVGGDVMDSPGNGSIAEENIN